jgi:hypothetical protein
LRTRILANCKRSKKDAEAVQLLEVAARVLAEHVCEIADIPDGNALQEFVNAVIPDQRHIQADIDPAA